MIPAKMTKTLIRFKAKLLRPTESEKNGSWTFLVLPKNASAKLPSRGMTPIEGTINRSHAAGGKLRTGVLWQDEKGPGTILLALGRPEEFRFEADQGFGHFGWYH